MFIRLFSACAGLFCLIAGTFKCFGILKLEVERQFQECPDGVALWLFSTASVISLLSGMINYMQVANHVTCKVGQSWPPLSLRTAPFQNCHTLIIWLLREANSNWYVFELRCLWLLCCRNLGLFFKNTRAQDIVCFCVTNVFALHLQNMVIVATWCIFGNSSSHIIICTPVSAKINGAVTSENPWKH